jgi:acetyl-CoA carboxylase biotin carboxyl carrier protein
LIQKSKISEFKYEDESTKFSIRTKSYTATKEVVMQPSMIHSMPVPSVTTSAIPGTVPNAEVQPVSQNNETPKEEANNYIEIKSPMVGTFYRSPSPEKGAFVKVGDTISDEDTVCLIEAMKLFNEVKAEVSGRIVKVLVEDASPVEYDQVLFLVEPV